MYTLKITFKTIRRKNRDLNVVYIIFNILYGVLYYFILFSDNFILQYITNTQEILQQNQAWGGKP